MSVYDLLIIGAGPAGLAAGIYAARAKMNTLILEKAVVGGQAFTTREIVNYPGLCQGYTGPQITEMMRDHATHFGAEIVKDEAVEVELEGEIKTIRTQKGSQYQAKAVILAAGAQPRLLNIPGEKELRGMGVSYCATCDAEFYEDLEVMVVGNGDAAVEEAIYLTKFASKVTIIVIHEKGKVDCNRVSAEKAFAHPKIDFIWNSVLSEIKGKDEVESVVVTNIKTGEASELPTNGVFIYVGMNPGTGFVKGRVALDERGYILANERMETNVDGVYAAGDARVKYLRQVVTAVNDGAIAAVAAEKYLDEEREFKSVLEIDQPTLMLFWNPMQEESIKLLSRLEKEICEDGQKVALVKVDTSRTQRVAQRYQVTQVPQVLLLKQGNLIRRFPHHIGMADLKADIQGELEKLMVSEG